MMLDCDTPLGKTFIEEQRNTEDILSTYGYTFISMPRKDSTSDTLIAMNVDGILTLRGIAEIKSRRMAGKSILTVDYLKQNGGYLITDEKLKYGKLVSEKMQVPFYIIVNLLEERKILIWQITSSDGEYEFSFETKDTATKMTCNGGTIVRTNSYLPMDKLKKIIIYNHERSI